MKTKIQLPLLLSFLLLSQVSFADAISHLDQPTQEKIRKGEVHYVFQNVGKPWNKQTAYTRLKATPEEAAALFHDYDRHHEYFPKIEESKVITPDASKKSVVEINYAMKVGKFGFIDLGIEHYTMKDTVSQASSEFGKSYQIQWQLVKADSMKASDGKAYFEPTKEGDTLLVYEVLVVPGQFGAGAVSGRADQGFKDAVVKLIERLGIFTTSERATLDGEIQLLRSSLGE